MFSQEFLYIPDGFTIDEKIVSAIFRYISEEVDIPQEGAINIAFLDDDEIQRLNKQHRSIDSTTDVLSFHYFDDFSELLDTDVAGEVILSESKIHAQATEYGNTLEEEFYKLLVHSLLHILGYDHETEEEYARMKEKEDVVLGRVKEEFGVSIK